MEAALRRLCERPLSRVALTGLLLIVTMQAYWALNASLAPRFDLSLPVDDAVPFLPWTIAVYLSLYAMVLLAAVVSSGAAYVELFAAVLLANALCYAGFVLFTAHYPRPALASIAPPWRAAFAMIFARDLPGNTFPSIHVATPVVVALQRRAHGPRGAAWLAWAALIAVSTVTVKQHFLVDIAGGVAVALVAHALVRRARGIA